MTPANPSSRRGHRKLTVGAGLLLAGAAATVGTALFFQHALGYIPCALCLQQRVPYYVAMPLAVVALVLAQAKAPVAVVRLVVAAIGLVMLWSLCLAVFHAGVEWHWWAGPTDCAAAGGADLTGDLLLTLDSVHPPACDRAAARFLGLSFAGWNALASVALAVLALVVAARPARD